MFDFKPRKLEYPDPNLRRNNKIDHNILANKFFVRYIIIYVLFTEDKYVGI